MRWAGDSAVIQFEVDECGLEGTGVCC